MRKTVLLLLALGVGLLCAATEVTSVRSSDTSKTSNTVSIELSGPASYSVEQLPGGKGVRLIIPEVSSLVTNPQYPRLSEVIDVVSARVTGGNAVIDIKTMDASDIRHQTNAGRNRITVSINSASTAQSATSAAASPRIEIPPGAMPKKVDQPDKISSPSATPSPQASRTVQPAPQTPAEQVSRPTLPATTAPQTDAIPPALDQAPEPPSEQTSGETETTGDSPGTESYTEKGRSSLPLYLIVAAAVLLCLLVILKFLVRKKPEPAAAIPVSEPASKPSEGKTLLLDDQTRRRVVQKLLAQGWTSSEIAREMMLDEQEVERIIADLSGQG